MQLTFLGKDTVNGGSPTLFATDRDTYVVQGWKVPGDELSVEIPDKLLAFWKMAPDWTRNCGLQPSGRH